jgi:outer membrane protein assembly factor BamB
VTALRLTDGGRIWQTRIGDVSSPMALRDSVLYVVNEEGLALALSASSGHTIWKRSAGPSRSGPLATSQHLVIATLRDSLIVLERETGTIVAAHLLPAGTAAPLALVDDTTVAITSPRGSIAAMSIRTGRVHWTVEANEAIPGAPVVYRDTVFALGTSCTLLRVPHHAPNVVRRDSLTDCVTVATPLVLSDGVLVATLSGRITYISRRTNARWSRHIGGALRHPPLVLDRQIVVATLNGEIFGLR